MIEASAAPADLGQELEEVALNLPAIQLEGVVAIRSRFGVVAVQRPVASGCHPYHPLTETFWLKSLLLSPLTFASTVPVLNSRPTLF